MHGWAVILDLHFVLQPKYRVKGRSESDNTTLRSCIQDLSCRLLDLIVRPLVTLTTFHLTTALNPFIKMQILVLLASLSFSLAATTLGPLATVSISSLQAYSTARPCAAGCLVFNGIWVCGVNGGYHDLGKDLGCGCSPTNACWCSAGIPAASYISSCVSAGCSKFGNVEGDIKTIQDLYGGYCATANVEPSSVPAQTTATTTASARATSKPTTGAAAASTPNTSPEPTKAPEAAKDGGEDEGLSKSDLIALGTGLGIGVPSLIVGIVALWFQLRKKKEKTDGPQVALNFTPASSQTQFLTKPPLTPPNVYELGERGGQRHHY
jgi:hypothetical protein